MYEKVSFLCRIDCLDEIEDPESAEKDVPDSVMRQTAPANQEVGRGPEA